jgi:acyl-CoA synthetase (NDP forming)
MHDRSGGLDAQQRQAIETLRALKRPALSESESKKILSAWGIPTTREVLVSSANAAVDAAQSLGYPVVVKIDSPDILHKTEAGVVRLGLRNADEVRSAYQEVFERATRHAPQAKINGVLVQEMVSR